MSRTIPVPPHILSFVEENWETLNKKQMSEALNVTHHVINKALRQLGVNMRNPSQWLEEEDKFLNANPHMSNREIAKRLGRTVSSIKWRRYRLNLDEADKPPRPEKRKPRKALALNDLNPVQVRFVIENKRMPITQLAFLMGCTEESAKQLRAEVSKMIAPKRKRQTA